MSTTNRRHISERQMQRKSLLLDKSQCLCVVSYNSRYFQAVPILKLFIWQRPGLKICFMPDNTTNQINGIIDWRATKAGRLGSIPVRVTPKTWKMVLPSLALGVNLAHEQFRHWLASIHRESCGMENSASKRRRTPQTSRNEYQWNWTENAPHLRNGCSILLKAKWIPCNITGKLVLEKQVKSWKTKIYWRSRNLLEQLLWPSA